MNMIEAYENLHGIKWNGTALSIRACWADAWTLAVENERDASAKRAKEAIDPELETADGESLQQHVMDAIMVRSNAK